MRIYRPGIWYLNPYFDDRNPMFISQGNSELESEKSHAFNLSYSSFSSKFNINVALRHSFNNNGIERVSRLIGRRVSLSATTLLLRVLFIALMPI